VIATADLRALASWDGVVTAGAVQDVCATPGSFLDGTLAPAAPWGGPPLNLQGLTARLQAETASAVPPGRPVPVWRLFEYGPISRLIPPGGRPPPLYLVVWVADGRDVLLLRAAALGAGELTATVQLAIRREPEGAKLWILKEKAQ